MEDKARTVKLLEYPVDGARTATAAHADIEFVGVLNRSGSGVDVGHFESEVSDVDGNGMSVLKLRGGSSLGGSR